MTIVHLCWHLFPIRDIHLLLDGNVTVFRIPSLVIDRSIALLLKEGIPKQIIYHINHKSNHKSTNPPSPLEVEWDQISLSVDVLFVYFNVC